MPDTRTVKIEKLVPGGEGLSHIEGKVVLVPYVLPGEVVQVRIIEEKKEYARAKLLKILGKSPQRRKSPCELFTICGGCNWLHISYSEQLRQKIALFQDAFTRIGKIQLPDPVIEHGVPLGYRNRVQFQVDNQGNTGFMQRGSDKIIKVNTCSVIIPSLEKLIKSENSEFENILKNGSARKKGKIYAFASTQWTAHTGSPDPLHSGGDLWVDLLGKRIYFNLECFFQSNLEMLPKLVQYAVNGFKGDIAMDLYCGVGLFGAFLIDNFHRIIAVEQNKKAIYYARKNIRNSNSFFFNKNVENLEQNVLGPHVQLILVNPPRTGLTKAARRFLIGQMPDCIVYVSCNPATQARDLKVLLNSGYGIIDYRLFDFYPQTSYVESVVKLNRNE